MLRACLFLPVVVLATLVLGPAMLLTAPLSARVTDRLVRLWCRLVLRTGGVRAEVRGAEGLQQGAAYVFMANHASHLDAPTIQLALRRPVRYVAKESLLRIPIFGWAARAIGTIPIDRGDPADARRRLQESEARLPPGVSVLFFAEGTRSDDGALQPFKRGGAIMALRLGLPVVPIAVRGTYQALPKGSLRVRPGPVRVDIGAPIPTTGLGIDQRGELTDQVRARVAELLARP